MELQSRSDGEWDYFGRKTESIVGSVRRNEWLLWHRSEGFMGGGTNSIVLGIHNVQIQCHTRGKRNVWGGWLAGLILSDAKSNVTALVDQYAMLISGLESGFI